jgi:hypothetical protein
MKLNWSCLCGFHCRKLEHVLFCKSLNGNAIIRAVSEVKFSEQNIEWHWCGSLCTDGTTAMAGMHSGFII